MQNQKGIFPPQRDHARGGTTLLVGIIIIVAIAFVAFGGVFAYQYFSTQKADNQLLNDQQSQQQQTDEQQTNNTQPTAQTAGPVPSEVEGWKTYTNNAYNYQISYVSSATIGETGGSVKIQYQNGNITICSASVGACGNVPGVGGEATAVNREVVIEGGEV